MYFEITIPPEAIRYRITVGFEITIPPRAIRYRITNLAEDRTPPIPGGGVPYAWTQFEKRKNKNKNPRSSFLSVCLKSVANAVANSHHTIANLLKLQA
jgi:hypothetical protein